MTMKSILAPMTGTAIDRPALDLALAIARPTGAHIEGFYARHDPREALAYVGMGMGGDMLAIGPIMEQLEREGREGSARSRRTLEDWRTVAGLAEAGQPGPTGQVTVGWREATGTPDQLVTQAAARADLVVCTALQPEPGVEQDLLEAALFGAARPVVTAPAALPSQPFHCAVIAWNGSHEANRAIAAALALLPRFAQVHLFCQAESHRAPADPTGAIELLAWHGIAARMLTHAASSETLGADLLNAAASVDASMLVMGAYTHGRMRQMMFGGVTHHVLHHAKLPTFLVH